MTRRLLAGVALVAALASPAIADDTPTAVAIANPSPKPTQPIALENALLTEMLLDDLQTQYVLSRNGATSPNGHPWRTVENDPFTRPFVRNAFALYGATLAANLAIRLLPPGRAKNLFLRIGTVVEGANDAANIRLILEVSR